VEVVAVGGDDHRLQPPQRSDSPADARRQAGIPGQAPEPHGGEGQAEGLEGQQPLQGRQQRLERCQGVDEPAPEAARHGQADRQQPTRWPAAGVGPLGQARVRVHQLMLTPGWTACRRGDPG
jgi:hypothetical protein